MLDVKNGLRDNAQAAFEEQVVDANYGAGERVFNGSQQSVRGALGNGTKSGVECCTWNSFDAFAEELNRRRFAECAGLALKRDPRPLVRTLQFASRSRA